MRPTGLKTYATLPLAVFGVMPAAGFAQATPISPPTREEIERLPVAPAAPPSSARVTVEGEVERAPCPLADSAYSNVTVELRGAEFSGLGPVSADRLRPAYADQIGKTVPIAAVCEIRDRAATILRRDGYLAAVQVPPQRIENGIVKFDVLMAKLVGFQVRGEAGKSEGIIQRYMKAIQDQPVFNILTAERYLLLARDLPGFDVRLTLRPAGTAPGEVIGEVQVVRTPVELDANIQNYGSHEVGRWGGLAQLRLNGIFGAGDRTTLGVFSTADFDEQQVVQASQEFRVGREGLTIAGDFNYAWTRPSLGPTIDLRSRTLVATLRARYPVIRRQSHNLFLSGGVDLIDQKSRLSGVPLTSDHLRVGFVRLDYDAIDPDSLASSAGYSAAEPRWRTGFGIELRQGFNILGASNGCGPAPYTACTAAGVIAPSRFEGDPTAFVVRAQGYVEFRPLPILGFSLQPRAQYAPHALFSYEEFSAGNYTIGRGYDPGTLIGDSGIGVRGEAMLGSLVPKSRTAFAVQGYAFTDVAKVWNKSLPANAGTPREDRLYSAGGGVRVAYGDRFQIDGGVAVPLRRAGTQTVRGDARFLLTLTAKLLPWSR